MSAARAFSPWLDRSAPRTRAWPPPSAMELADVLRDVRTHDRYGHAVHACAAIVFAYFATLDQAPNGIATGILLGTWFARVLRFPVLLTALFRWPAFWFGFTWCAWSAITVAWSPMGAGAFKLLAAQRLLLVALACAGIGDVRTRRIPNWLTAGAAAFALASVPSPLVAISGALAALLAGMLLVLAARGAYGMGDVKAMAVAGATVGVTAVPAFLCWMALAGGIWVTMTALRTRSLRGQTVAYGPAIAAGCAITLLLR